MDKNEIKNEEESLEQISEKMNKYKIDIEKELKVIETNPHDFDKIIKAYNNIFKIDNTQEIHILNYLLYIKEMAKNNNNINEINFRNQLNKYQICISDKNYNKYFKDIKRKNARQKIIDFFNLIKDFSPDDKESKKNIVESINNNMLEIYFFKFNNKKKITWDNEELYLNYLYKFLVTSVSGLIIYYYDKNKCNSKVLKDPEYINLTENVIAPLKEKNEKMNPTLNYLLINIDLYYSTFFDYIDNMKEFLKGIEKSFDKRFGKLELVNMDDKQLFEDFIHFLSTYKFETSEYISFWNETFSPMSYEEKKEIIKTKCTLKFELIDNGNKLKISKNTNSDEINANIYDFSNLIYNSKNLTNIDKFKWNSNRYILPNHYKDNLFVYKTRTFWKKLLIDIFRSKAYNEVRDSLFTKSQINIFKIDSFISNIIDNIKFFIYNTTFFGNTNKESNTVYEYGIYNLEIENHSVALLIFYGFHIIINIHEIGGHLNIRYQYYFSLDETFHSPEITSNEKDFYSKYAQGKGGESGETIEIRLFGEVKYSLTIKEALFVLNKNNYELSSKDFKNNFQKCNEKSIDELLNNSSLIELLLNLGINVNDLNDNDKFRYNYPLNRKTNENNAYFEYKSRHPISYYYTEANLFKKFFEMFNTSADDKKKE